MNLLTQLLLQPLPEAKPKACNTGVRKSAAEIYRPHMLGKGPMGNLSLRKLTGRSSCAVNQAMNLTLIPSGLVRKHLRTCGNRPYYVFEWIGE